MIELYTHGKRFVEISVRSTREGNIVCDHREIIATNDAHPYECAYCSAPSHEIDKGALSPKEVLADTQSQ